MGDLVKADLDALRALSGTLNVEADSIGTIMGPVSSGLEAVVMPGAGIDELLGRINEKLGANITEHETNVRQMSQGAATAANSYEEVDTVFKGQLDGLRSEVE
ncbi:hypothetical protein BOX37_29705 [Nocardia mangyaensis]|uniref:ESX-1 secretion-associated protein n=1 Tax=Nocardia mangyaensis TaxID=2213200 RepID=A0A1J0VZQ8_9NOCA|nr:hypothetical protein [Nocardia mangyaensis]APE37415.1 hypothetical protein BOX37_29705 [Nocardia mangyaensis]